MAMSGRSLLLTAFFGYFLWRQKVTKPVAAMSDIDDALS